MQNSAYGSESVNIDSLVDIRDVSVNKSFPKDQRIAEYIRQIQNPYQFRKDDIVINARFSSDGVRLEDCIANLFR